VKKGGSLSGGLVFREVDSHAQNRRGITSSENPKPEYGPSKQESITSKS